MITYPADWNKHGKRAGYIRNISIANSCNICVAFWDYESPGTKITIDLVKQSNKKLIIINLKPGIMEENTLNIMNEIKEIKHRYEKHAINLKKYIN